MGPRDYFDIVRRHARPIAAIAVLCAVAALVTSLSVTPVYQADAKLLVLAKSDPEGGTSSAYEGALLSQQLVKSFVQVLQSRPTAEAALRGDPDPISVDALQQRVHADPIPETLLIRLSVDDVDPDRARRLTNSVASAFIKRLPKLQSGSAVRVSLVEPPRRPLAPVKPRIPLNVALGLVLGLLVGTGLAFLRDFLDRSIRSPERLEAASGTPVVGTIPPFNAGELPTRCNPSTPARWPCSPLASSLSTRQSCSPRAAWPSWCGGCAARPTSSCSTAHRCCRSPTRWWLLAAPTASRWWPALT